jgi:inosine-uridine nucleoside N-ribohydrolase
MRRKKLIIDTDPGIGACSVEASTFPRCPGAAAVEGRCALGADDAMAILAAFNSEEVEVIGITTIFGNVKTSTATDNAFILLSLAGCPEVQHLR